MGKIKITKSKKKKWKKAEKLTRVLSFHKTAKIMV